MTKEISRRIKGEIKIEREDIENILEWKEEIQKSEKETITQVCEKILEGVVSLNVSDLHFEPKQFDVLMRARIDGLLYEIFSFSKDIYKDISARLKLASGVKINITDRPQEGRFTIKLKEREIEVRTSCLPAEWGETLVLRFLDPKNIRNISELGLREDLLDLIKREIRRPHGMIIVTGPAGVGKTTSLYAFLMELKKPEIKIITIENPIEYHLPGIIQTQVDPKKNYDFVNGLKYILRQDPDIILIGEIRDKETADLALQAALTGHLVFTTLHTKDATQSVSRLLSLGCKPFNVAPALKVVIGQRLVRKVCQFCAEYVEPQKEIKEKIEAQLKNLPKKVKIPKEFKIPKAKGCPKCNFVGYKGRTGVFEVFLVDEEIEGMILSFTSSSALRKKAIEKGMTTMLQDGLIKVLNKITTLEEVESVVELL